jgi:hypothetical protein
MVNPICWFLEIGGWWAGMSQLGAEKWLPVQSLVVANAFGKRTVYLGRRRVSAALREETKPLADDSAETPAPGWLERKRGGSARRVHSATQGDRSSKNF